MFQSTSSHELLRLTSVYGSYQTEPQQKRSGSACQKGGIKIIAARSFKLFLLLFFVSCATAPESFYSDGFSGPAKYPDTNLALISDVHVCYIPEAGGSIPSRDVAYSKLLEKSIAILDEAGKAITEKGSSLVIVSGDLTEYGERSNHERAASGFREIEASGARLYVIPGNHDVQNYNASLSPSGPGERRISPSEFAEIYSEFGYGEAIYRDGSSLSYVCEPEPGLWLLGLDSARYDENSEKNPSVTGGRLEEQTLGWAQGILALAREKRIAVIAFMHHNLIEHFYGQKKYFGAYVAENNEAIAELLRRFYVRLVFTGHYHAQDIVLSRGWDGKFLFDVETASLASFPNPIRFVRIDGASQKAHFSSTRVASLPGEPGDFAAYSKARLMEAAIYSASSVLKKFGMSQSEAEIIANQAANGYMAHSEGDENPDDSVWNPFGAGCIYGSLAFLLVSELAWSVWRDLPPPDDDITIDLDTGEWKTSRWR